MRSKTDD